jgi:nicotinic acid mononucleotide adenylyltransferase
MNYQKKYLKYKSKYLHLKKYGGSPENTIHIYNGGSFSPPTIAHQQICIDTFSFLMNHFKESHIDTIILHLVPTSDMYDKPSVKPECVPYDARKAMLDIMAQNIKEKLVVSHKAYTLNVVVDNIEQIIAYQDKPDGSGPNGYIGTYKYLHAFATHNGFIPHNIYLLYGLDNAISLVTSSVTSDGKIKRWKNPLHLVSNFKFLIYPRSGSSVDHSMLSSLFNSNLELFLSKPDEQEEINLTNGKNNLDDIDAQLKSFVSNPAEFMTQRFIEVSNSASSAGADIISIAELSSSSVRKVLYDYSSHGFTLKESKINEILETVDPKIRDIARTLYKNGKACEGESKFADIVSGIPADWKN